MKRGSFGLGLAVVAVALFGSAATASAKSAPVKKAAPVGKGCVVNSLPSFISQGLEKQAGSVADIVEVECELSGSEQYDGSVTISNMQLRNRCAGKLAWVVESTPGKIAIEETATVTVPLDGLGNATVAVIAGPGCKPGASEFLVDEVSYPFETYMAAFAVATPKTTPESIEALDPCPEKEGVCHSKVESNFSSGVFTILQVEFPVVEAKVDVNAEQMITRCSATPHTIWVTGSPAKVLAVGAGRLEGATALETDDLGNAWVLLIGTRSCQPGKVKLEAALEAEPVTSVFGEFLIEFPRRTI